MLARSVDRLPEPDAVSSGYRWEPKWDGYRALAFIDDSGRVEIYGRRGTLLAGAFPEIVGQLFAWMPEGTVVDRVTSSSPVAV